MSIRICLLLALLLAAPSPALAAEASVVTLLRQSQQAAARGQVDQAMEMVEQALSQDPAYPPLWNQKASLLIRKKDYAGALDTLAIALKVEPDNVATNVLELTALLRQDEASGGKEPALGRYVGGLKEDMASALLLDLLARPGAKADLRRFLGAWEPASADGRLAARLAAGYASGDPASLRELAAAPAAVSRKDVLGALQFYAGKEMLAQQRLDLAGNLLEAALANNYDQVAVDGELGWVYYNQGDPAKAADLWEKDWRSAPNVGLWASWIAGGRLAAKDYKRAAEFLDKSLQFDPKNPVLQGQYLMALNASGQTGAAEAYAGQLRGEPNQDGLNFGLAMTAWHQGDFPGAAEALGRIQNKKTFRDQFVDLADAMVRHIGKGGDADKTIADVRALVEDMDIKPAILRDIGWRLWAVGRKDPALAFWKESLASGLSAGDPLVARVVPLLIETGKTGEEVALFRANAPEVTPLGLAWSLAAANRWDLVGKVLAGGPSGPYPDLLSAMAGLQNGQAPMALGKLRTLADLPAGGLGQAPVTGFNADGRVVRGLLTPELGRELYLRIARTLAADQLVEGFFFLTPPAWAAGVPPKAMAPVQAEAGRVLWRTGKLDEAARFLEAALAGDPAQNQARLYLALVRKRQGRAEEAGRLLAAALAKASPFDRDYALGEFALADGDAAGALARFQACLALAPADELLRLRVIDMLVAGNRFAQAREYAKWYEERAAKNERAIFSATAVVRLELGDAAGAEALYRRLLADNPNSRDYLAGLGRAMNRQNKFDQTVAALSPAYAASADPALGGVVCEALMALGEYREVVRQAEVGLARRPDDRELVRFAAEASEFARDPAGSEAYVRRYLALDPGSLTMQNMLGRLLLDQEKFPEAKERFEALLAQNPRHLSSLRGLLSVYQLTGQAREAYRVAKALYEAAPDDASARMKFAIAAAAEQDFRPAYPTLEKLRDFGPGSPVLCLHYSDVRDTEAPGKVRLSQLADHIRLVAARNGTFLGVDDLARRPAGDAALGARDTDPNPAVLLLIDRTDAAVLEKIDALLAAVGGKAVLVVGGESLAPATPYLPDAAAVARLSGTGRWSLALTDHNPPAVPGPDGTTTTFWNVAGAAPDTAGSAAMAARIKALDPTGEILGQTRPVFFYPGGNAPDELLAADAAGRDAYAQAVADAFPMAFELNPEGFWTPITAPRRIAARAVSPSLDAGSLGRYLDQGNPMHQVSLELAKVYSWQEQLGQAENYFREAEELKVNPADETYNHAVNAYYRHDDPVAVALAEQAVALAPDSGRAALQLDRAKLRTRPQAEAMATTWWDSDNRRYWWTGLGGNVHIWDSLVVFARAGGVEWSLDSFQRQGQMQKALANTLANGTVAATDLQAIARARHTQYLSGQDLTVGGRLFFQPGYWLEIQGQLTGTEGGPGTWANGQATLHGPLAPKGVKVDGTWDIQAAHERIDTVEAISAQIMANRLSLFTHNRILDFWDLFLNIHGIARTDGNNTASIDGRLLRRLVEFPLISLGYAFQFASSDRNPIEYWAPQNLATHLAYAAFGYAPTRWFNLNGSLGYGTSSDRGDSWREVWRANAGMDITLKDRLKLSLKYSYFSTPNYNLNEAWAGINYTF